MEYKDDINEFSFPFHIPKNGEKKSFSGEKKDPIYIFIVMLL